MSEPDIAPLARRLAEQNNVDWRRLKGSGEGGRIVERDVLDYLARVMAGEEAVDPTPEPLPEGMEAWPGQDMAAVRQGVGEAATLGELRQEIGSAVRDEGGAEVGEDVFLFEDEPAAVSEAAPATAAAPEPAPVGDDLDDLLVSGDELLPAEEGAAGQADVDAFASAAAPADEPQWGAGIELGDPAAPAAGQAVDVWGEAAKASGDDLDLFGDASGSGGADDYGFGEQRYDEPDLWVAPEATRPEAGASASDDIWTTGGEADEPSPYDAWASETAGAGHGGSDAGAGYDFAAAEADAPAGAAAPDPAEPSPYEAFATAEPDAGTEDVAEAGLEAADGEPPMGMAAVAAPSVDGLPLARLPTVLRRHVDVSALASAQLAVSQELGYEEPLNAAPFLLRAVAKAAAELESARGQVALAAFGGGVTLRRVDGAATRPFAEIVRELQGPGGEEDEAGLVAADLSGLDVDEVVLDVGVPVVSLGRILYDNQSGGYRSTLTLAGDLPADAGARLLSRVAELLDSPVRLVM